MANVESKKVFISYSWTMKERVRQIADQLISSGIKVIIEIYDLKPGDNKYAFMERSVNDQTVDRKLKKMTYMGIFNPRLNIAYSLNPLTINSEILEQVKKEVIGYE